MNLIIKEVANKKGFTGVKLAKEVGMTQQNMSNIMNNKLTPSLDTLEKIANVLDVSVYELFEDYTKRSKETLLSCPNCGANLELIKKE